MVLSFEGAKSPAILNPICAFINLRYEGIRKSELQGFHFFGGAEIMFKISVCKIMVFITSWIQFVELPTRTLVCDSNSRNGYSFREKFD